MPDTEYEIPDTIMKHLNIKITGRVQGVFFRVRAKEKADELGLAGAVWNAPDGSVRAEVEGDEPAINAFLAWCREGSPSTDIERVEAGEGGVRGMSGFVIRV
jgi:acylphosphatase